MGFWPSLAAPRPAGGFTQTHQRPFVGQCRAVDEGGEVAGPEPAEAGQGAGHDYDLMPLLARQPVGPLAQPGNSIGTCCARRAGVASKAMVATDTSAAVRRMGVYLMIVSTGCGCYLFVTSSW